MRRGPHKLLLRPDLADPQLFDISSDRNELHDIRQEFPDLARAMEQDCIGMHQWFQQLYMANRLVPPDWDAAQVRPGALS